MQLEEKYHISFVSTRHAIHNVIPSSAPSDQRVQQLVQVNTQKTPHAVHAYPQNDSFESVKYIWKYMNIISLGVYERRYKIN